ncbi:MAG: hypothetical protein ACOH5I_01015 [Oligoflexus sp.]
MQKERIIGLDLIRLLSFAAIVTFHSSLLYFYLPENPFLDISPIIYVLDTFARILAFSGFTIVLLASFLLVYAGNLSMRRAKLFAALGFGWLTLSYLTSGTSSLTWDVYSLYLVGMAIYIAFPKLRIILGFVGFILLWIPFWQLSSIVPYLNADFQAVLGLSPCVGQAIAEWPLLPWIGLVWVGNSLGSLARYFVQNGKQELFFLRCKEMLAWAAILAASVPQWGAYFNIRLGPYFSCDAYRQEPYVFWSHMTVVLFCMRISFDPRVQAILKRQYWSRSLSELAISRHFFLAYLLSYVYTAIMVMILSMINQQWPRFYAEVELVICEFFGCLMIIQIELLTRTILRWKDWMLTRQATHLLKNRMKNGFKFKKIN